MLMLVLQRSTSCQVCLAPNCQNRQVCPTHFLQQCCSGVLTRPVLEFGTEYQAVQELYQVCIWLKVGTEHQSWEQL